MIKKIVNKVVDPLRKVKREQEKLARKGKSPEEVFSEIYDKGLWGSEGEEFCSGVGSVQADIVQPYIQKLIGYLQENEVGTVVDLGCGDFKIGGQLAPHCKRYIACDVVPSLISHHKQGNHSEHVSFHALDIIEEELPAGDVCFIRQVFQHLSNEQIMKVLPKLKQYPVLFITEHYPTQNEEIVPNCDIVHGSEIRLYQNSGVYLWEPPFGWPKEVFEEFLNVPCKGLQNVEDQGQVTTFKILWQK